MTHALRVTALLSVVLLTASSAGEPPVLELDHVYIVVTPGAVAEAAALRRAGLVIDTAVTRHDGQGTASRAAFFENGYVELLWVDSAVTVDSLHRSDLADFQRASAWRHTGASPFGVGLHFLSGSPADLPIPTRLDSAARLGPGTYYVLLRQPAETLAPDIFVMPTGRAVPAWIGRYRRRRPDVFTHPLGAGRITHVTLRGPPQQRPRAATLETRLVSFEAASDPCLVVEFDGGRRGERWDLRPALPLILQR